MDGILYLYTDIWDIVVYPAEKYGNLVEPVLYLPAEVDVLDTQRDLN